MKQHGTVVKTNIIEFGLTWTVKIEERKKETWNSCNKKYIRIWPNTNSVSIYQISKNKLIFVTYSTPLRLKSVS